MPTSEPDNIPPPHLAPSAPAQKKALAWQTYTALFVVVIGFIFAKGGISTLLRPTATSLPTPQLVAYSCLGILLIVGGIAGVITTHKQSGQSRKNPSEPFASNSVNAWEIPDPKTDTRELLSLSWIPTRDQERRLNRPLLGEQRKATLGVFLLPFTLSAVMEWSKGHSWTVCLGYGLLTATGGMACLYVAWQLALKRPHPGGCHQIGLSPAGLYVSAFRQVTLFPWQDLQSITWTNEGDLSIKMKLGVLESIPHEAFPDQASARRFYEAMHALWESQGSQLPAAEVQQEFAPSAAN